MTLNFCDSNSLDGWSRLSNGWNIGPHFSRSLWESVGKMRARITPNTDTFYAVLLWLSATKLLHNPSLISPFLFQESTKPVGQ